MITLNLLQAAQETAATDRYADGLLTGLLIGSFGTMLMLLLTGPIILRGLDTLLREAPKPLIIALRQLPVQRRTQPHAGHRILAGIATGFVVSAVIAFITLGLRRLIKRRTRG